MSHTPANPPEELPRALPASLARVISGRARGVGGLPVTRLLPAGRCRNVGPFVFLDHMGPLTLEPGQGFDVPPHPHIGLSTVTYLFEGVAVHRDSLGSEQPIEPGALNLMLAGRGIAHSERTPPEARARGPRLHGLQLWLALPLEVEEAAPEFRHHPASTLPAWSEGGVGVRLLLGSAFGRSSPASDPSRPLFVDLEFSEGGAVDLSSQVEEAGVYVVEGELSVNGHALREHELAVRAGDHALALSARKRARAVVIGGAALDSERFIDWNFVASSRERLERAKADWRAQRFPKIPGDEREFVPLP